MSMHMDLASHKRRSDLTDDDLIQQAHTGDQGAFESLVERYSLWLFPLICYIVRNEHIAHDVLQRVLLQLCRSLPTLVPGGTLQAWLGLVARHRSIDELRCRHPILFCEIEPDLVRSDFSYLFPGSMGTSHFSAELVCWRNYWENCVPSPTRLSGRCA